MSTYVLRIFPKLRVLVTSFVVLSFFAAPPVVAAVDCETMAAQAGAQLGFPNALLPSIARIESGKLQGDLGVRAWPWTLNQAGKGMYFETREDAMEYLREAVASGVTNIDIGCMQINYRWHKDEFSSLEEMMNPVANTRYAATFLRRLYDRHKDWEIATRYYHSPKEERGKWYQGKVASVMQRILGEAPIRLASATASEMTTATSIENVPSRSTASQGASAQVASQQETEPQDNNTQVRRVASAQSVYGRNLLAPSSGGALINVNRPATQVVALSQPTYADLIPSGGPLQMAFFGPSDLGENGPAGFRLHERRDQIEAFRAQFSN